MSECLIETKATVRFSVRFTWVHTKNGKKKNNPCTDHEGSGTLRPQEGGGKVISPTHRSPLPPRK